MTFADQKQREVHATIQLAFSFFQSVHEMLLYTIWVGLSTSISSVWKSLPDMPRDFGMILESTKLTININGDKDGFFHISGQRNEKLIDTLD